MPASRFTVARADLRDARIEDDVVPALAAGQVRLRIDSFALTANNITYAAFGDAMHYWDFFPCSDPTRGCIPVWGFAEVTASQVDGVVPGERFYGYYPMAQQVTLSPVRVGPAGFGDGAPHRRELAAFYNHYTRCSADPAYRADQEAQIALLRPLFSTAFLIDDFLAEQRFFGARTLLLSSASSKTAWATAFCLAQRRDHGGTLRIVGLTSAANRDYTEGLGLYDQVCSYEVLPEVAAGGDVVYVDFSGAAALRQQVHERYGDRLAYSCAVGGTHWQDLGSAHGLPGPRPTLFFAPARIRQRMADWGPTGLAERLAAAWQAFMQPVNDPANPWLRVVRGAGPQALRSAYLAQLDGRVPAAEGQVLSL